LPNTAEWRRADRRLSTHAVRQNPLARFFLVLHNIGFHTAHHVDAGIPFSNLPDCTRRLRDVGYITPECEYASYPRIWWALWGARELPLPA
jgi:fatty acid desaturase